MAKVLLNSTSRLPGGTASAITLGMVYITSPAVPGTGESVMVDVITLGTVEVPFGVPTLPSSVPDTSLPVGWDGVADYTPVDSAALVSDLASAASDSGLVIIELTAGTTYTGNFVIDNSGKPDSSWTIIRSSGYASLPASGTRVNNTTDLTNMPKLTSTGNTLRVDFNAKNVRFLGLELETTGDGTNFVCINSYNASYQGPSAAQQCDGMIYDRCYIHGPGGSTRVYNGIVNSGDNFAVVDSYFDGCTATDGEVHGVHVYAGGPCLIDNNYIEAGHMNVFIGDNDNIADDIRPSDITVTRNYLFKSLTWKGDDPSYAGVAIRVKNHFEIKGGDRILFEGNINENCWWNAQKGGSIVITPRGEPAADITVKYNHVINSHRAANITPAANTLAEVLLEHNVMYFERRMFTSGDAGFGPVNNIIVRHNTMIMLDKNEGLWKFEAGPPALANVTVTDNIMPLGAYGLTGTGTPPEHLDQPLDHWADGYLWDNNLLIEHTQGQTPFPITASFANTSYESDYPSVGFTDTTFDDLADVTLATGTYRAGQANDATDGTDMGADITTLTTKTAGCISGDWS